MRLIVNILKDDFGEVGSAIFLAGVAWSLCWLAGTLGRAWIENRRW